MVVALRMGDDPPQDLAQDLAEGPLPGTSY